MKKSFLLFIALLANTYAVSFDTTVHCACGELNQTECDKSMAEFKVSYTETIQKDCTGFSTGYKCAWENSECVEKSYTCGDFSTTDDCPSSIDCYWNRSEKCASFSSCADYEPAKCKPYKCTNRSGTCQQITCASYTAENDCSGADSDTTQCAWTTDGKCQSLSKTATCTDLSNYKSRCESSGSCKYASNACSFKTCADFNNENQCRTVRSSETARTLCAWSGTACADAADTSKLTTETCFDTSYYNYRWTSDGKCQECSDLVSDDISSNAVILSVFVALALIA